MREQGDSKSSSSILTTGEKNLVERWKSSKNSEDDLKLVEIEKQDNGRRLAAIMFTDMAGYTALTERDEVLALQILEEHGNLLRSIFKKHSGKVVKTIGDGFIVEFSSALKAVQCSLTVQSAIADFNHNHPSEMKVQLRIGVHLGDVIHKDNDVYGDAVNIASRIESLCAPGSVCITEQVFSQVRNKIGRTFVSLGKRKLKNVEIPVRIYALGS